MVDVLTLGEALACLRADGLVRDGTSARLSVAGAESNVAIGLARLGHLARWVGVVGPDQLGNLVRRTLTAEGVDTSGVRGHAAPTGIVLFEQRLAGLTRVDYHRLGSAGSRLCPEDLAGAFTPAPRMLHVTGLTMALGDGPAEAVRTAVRLAREHGAEVCLDVNHRGRLWTADQARDALTTLTGGLDIVIASDDELALIAPAGADVADRAESLLENGASQVVVKLGANGATAYTTDGVLHAAARPVTAVDTVGAGDAFVAGYLSGVLDELPVAQRLDRAITLGAFAVATIGDWEGLPTREELAMLDLPSGSTVR